MCGITGFFCFQGTEADASNQLKRMVSMLHHRGPDECGIYLDNHVGLGHTRLSIIDLSTGQQPLHNEDETMWIVFNGEIFNYPELREELENSGHQFYTQSDTEVIIHLYEEKGASCVDDLNGQFAFAIWDTKTKRLFIARDRVGIRPLYYTLHNDTFFFASEIKSIFASNSIPREIDAVSLDQIFTMWAPLPGKTFFKNIFELRPGHCAIIAEESFVEKKYWEIPYHPKHEHLINSPQELSEEVRALLIDAVRIQLRSDVPVGTYLSGGLDSSGISALVAKYFNADVQTFGIRFEEPDFDEGVFQKQMSSFLQVHHHELYATNQSIAEAFPKVIWHCEKPILRTAPAPLFLLSSFVRENGLKVVLTGEGADEIFGGYDIFKEALLRQFLSRQPQSSFRSLPFSYLYPDIFKNERAKKSMHIFFSTLIEDVHNPFFSHAIRWKNTSRIKLFFSGELKKLIGNYDVYDDLQSLLPNDFAKRDCLAKAQYLETFLFLSNYLLSSQGDRVAMAHSLEIRVPFLDHRIIEFMARVNPLWKILGMNEKYLLKKAFKSILPDAIVKRTKHPYRAPIQQSLFSSFALDGVKDILSESSLRKSGLFDPIKVKHLLNKSYTATMVNEVDGMALAGIYSTQLLYEYYISQWSVPGNNGFRPVVSVDRRKNT
jgi:asparagine synthase (glutamine-hydrolysing)